jgi:hypothetical protein
MAQSFSADQVRAVATGGFSDDARLPLPAQRSTSAWSALTAAVARHPALVVFVALLLPLLCAAAVFLALFAFPIGVVALVFMKSGPEEVDVASAASHVFARPELWALIAEHSGFMGAWRLTGVCRASREGAKERLRGDEKVLRFWRQVCPELRPLWPAEADVSMWQGVTFHEGEHGGGGD